MLSQPERRRLDEIERWLAASDSELNRALAGRSRSRNPRHSKAPAFAVYALGTLLVVLGSVTVSIAVIGLGIVGLVIGACLHVSHRRTAR
jgi:hypothetical protein